MLPRIAFRNLWRHRRRTLLTGAMIAFGLALALLTQSMVDGSYSRIIEGVTRDHTGHVQIHVRGYLDDLSIYDTIRDPAKIEAILKREPRVVSWAPRVRAGALAFVGDRTTATYVVGIDPVRESATTTIRDRIIGGSYLDPSHPDGVLLSSQVADNLKVKVGTEIALVAQAADGSIANARFRVSGVLKDDGESEDGIYLALGKAQDFLSLDGAIHEVSVRLQRYQQAEEVTQELNRWFEQASLSSIQAESWEQVESSFYHEMQGDRSGSGVLYGVILAVVALGVLNTVLMGVLERTYEFGLLKAVGTRPSMIAALILTETAILAALACVAGMALATPFNYFLATRGIPLGTAVSVGAARFDRLMGTMAPTVYVIPTVISFFSAMLVSLWPAIRAARIVPVEALRSS